LDELGEDFNRRSDLRETRHERNPPRDLKYKWPGELLTKGQFDNDLDPRKKVAAYFAS